MSEDPLLPQILVLIILIFFNAFFAAAEIAVISLSEGKVRKQAEEGDKKAAKLLKLVQAPDNFLSTIQIGITLAGFLASAFAADAFSDRLVRWLVEDRGVTALSAGTLNTIMVVVITLILSYFTLVFGELVPKRLAMKKTEGVARAT
ncbi:MAG: CNNM domain-containing protein, partial [Oscillospiraceae bacterium]